MIDGYLQNGAHPHGHRGETFAQKSDRICRYISFDKSGPNFE